MTISDNGEIAERVALGPSDRPPADRVPDLALTFGHPVVPLGHPPGARVDDVLLADRVVGADVLGIGVLDVEDVRQDRSSGTRRRETQP